jgi:hypothetical protein
LARICLGAPALSTPGDAPASKNEKGGPYGREGHILCAIMAATLVRSRAAIEGAAGRWSRISTGSPAVPSWRQENVKRRDQGGNDMLGKIIMAATSGAVLALSPLAFAHPADKYIAKAMLMTAAAEVNSDSKQAFDQFNQGKGKYLNGMSGNIYVFCINAGNGKFVAMGNANRKELLGQDIRILKDETGKGYGQEIYDAGQKPEGEITEVHYQFARPTDPKPAAKTSFVTRVDSDFACGVGYYN